MHLSTFCLKAVVLASMVTLPAYGMFKKPQNPFEKEISNSKQIALYKPQQKPKQASSQLQQVPRLTRRSFNDLPEHLQIQIADYLNYDDQFRLAQTSRQQLFLWGSVSRVPEPVPVITSTPEVTRFNWDDAVWPTTVQPTVVIRMHHSVCQDTKNCEELERLVILSGREQIQHLHFEGTLDYLYVDIDPIFSNAELFPIMSTLTFNRITPLWYTAYPGILTLRHMVMTHINWENRFIPGRLSMSELFLNHPHFTGFFFQGMRLPDEVIKYLLRSFNRFSRKHKSLMTLDIRNSAAFQQNTHITYFQGRQVQISQPILETPLNYATTILSTRNAILRINEQDYRVPWQRLFSFLVPNALDIRSIMRIITQPSHEGRLTYLETHIQGSRWRRTQDNQMVLDISGVEERNFWRQIVDQTNEEPRSLLSVRRIDLALESSSFHQQELQRQERAHQVTMVRLNVNTDLQTASSRSPHRMLQPFVNHQQEEVEVPSLQQQRSLLICPNHPPQQPKNSHSALKKLLKKKEIFFGKENEYKKRNYQPA